MARELGYVDTLWGRKRRLPKMQLPKYEFDFTQKQVQNFDVLDFDNNDEENNFVDYDKIDYYTKLLDKAYGRVAKEKIIQKAKEEGIIIKDNAGYISSAERQCVNSRIQGSAADMTKKAMLIVGNDKRLKELDFKLLLAVHDELIAECPIKNAKECSERFSYLMSIAANDKIDVPIKCDITLTREWYGKELSLEELDVK